MDAIQNLLAIFGPATATFAIFEFSEQSLAREVKERLTVWLKAFDPDRLTLPHAATEYFQYVFGENHFSIKCLVRSLLFSLAAGVLFAALHFWKDDAWKAWAKAYGDGTSLPYTILYLQQIVIIGPIAAYFYLYKTRLILTALDGGWITRVVALPFVLMLDFVIGYILFRGSFLVMYWLLSPGGPISIFDAVSLRLAFEPRNIEHWLHFRTMDSALFYAAMIPSFWLWIYVAAVFATRLLLRGKSAIRILMFTLNVDEKPFRSVGILAAAFVGLFSILLFGIGSIIG